MRPLLRTLAACTVALGLALASPSVRAECTSYTAAAMAEDLGAMTVAMRTGNDSNLTAGAKRIEIALPCLKTPVNQRVLASAYRYIGAGSFIAGDTDKARRWFRAGLELEDTFAWDITELEEGSPMRGVFEEERAAAGAAPVAVAGKALEIPAGSKLLLDGRPLTKAAATPNRPHLLQVVAQSDNTVREVFVIEGNAIPEKFLIDEALAAAAAPPPTKPEKKKGVKPVESRQQTGNIDSDYQEVVVYRVRPKAKTPMMVAGGVVALGAGAIYGVSFTTMAKFESAKTTAELDKYKGLTNTLVIASGATLAAGIGLTYTGIMLDGGGGPMITWQGRF
jgi:hypothetical protein